MFFVYIFRKNIKQKKNIKFIKNIGNCFLEIFLKGFHGTIQSNLLDFPFLSKKLNIEYLWIFYEKKYYFFLNIFEISLGPFFSFQILAFSLKKELNYQKKKDHKTNRMVLILNNFTEKTGKFLLLEKLMRKMFTQKNQERPDFKSQATVLMIDFTKETKFFEFRIYILSRINILIPRKFRKKSSLKVIRGKENYSKSPKNFEKIENFEKKNNLIKMKKEKISSLKLEELGPRFSLKNLETRQFFSLLELNKI